MNESDQSTRSVLPYTCIVGQEKLKLALELAYIAPRLGGVLISGKRGTAKSTTARAFSVMISDHLPVTIPINATEDRVVGGWNIPELLKGNTKEMPGLLREADGKLLYIDEVNLLDDHIVNIILDVTSTGKLVVQREGLNEQYDVHTTLIGTMNPEEGNLRLQLLDRFGLMVEVSALTAREQRSQILTTVLRFDRALQQEEKLGQPPAWLLEKRNEAKERCLFLQQARERLLEVELTEEVSNACVLLSEGFHVEGHRSDYLLALAACAHAALQSHARPTLNDLLIVAELVLRHRQSPEVQDLFWREEQQERVQELITHA